MNMNDISLNYTKSINHYQELISMKTETSTKQEPSGWTIPPFFGYFFGLYIQQCIVPPNELPVDLWIENSTFYEGLLWAYPKACELEEDIKEMDDDLLNLINLLNDLHEVTQLMSLFDGAQQIAGIIDNFRLTLQNAAQAVQIQVENVRTYMDPALTNICVNGKKFFQLYDQSKALLNKNYFPNVCNCLKGLIATAHTPINTTFYALSNIPNYTLGFNIPNFSINFNWPSIPGLSTIINFLSGIFDKLQYWLAAMEYEIDIIPWVLTLSVEDILRDFNEFMSSIEGLLNPIIQAIVQPIQNLITSIENMIPTFLPWNVNLTSWLPNLPMFNFDLFSMPNLNQCLFSNPFV